MRWQDRVDTLEREGLYQHLLLCHYNGTTVDTRGSFTLSSVEILELFERLSNRRTQHIVLAGKTFLTTSNDGVVLVASRPGMQVVVGRKLVSCLVAVTEDHDREKRKVAEQRLREVLCAPDSVGKPVPEKAPAKVARKKPLDTAKSLVRSLLPPALFLLFS